MNIVLYILYVYTDCLNAMNAVLAYAFCMLGRFCIGGFCIVYVLLACMVIFKLEPRKFPIAI